MVLDGIAVLSGGLVGDESVSSPVLLSDIELEARLMLLRASAERWSEEPITEDLLVRARRRAAYIRLMARQARQAGEEIPQGQRTALRAKLEKLAGGEARLAALLGSCGADEDDLDAWMEDALLALAQLTYLRERIEPPGDEEIERLFEKGQHPYVGRDFKEVEARFRRHVMDQRVLAELINWLRSTLEHRQIRIVN